jgi:hypothetical protein
VRKYVILHPSMHVESYKLDIWVFKMEIVTRIGYSGHFVSVSIIIN